MVRLYSNSFLSLSVSSSVEKRYSSSTISASRSSSFSDSLFFRYSHRERFLNSGNFKEEEETLSHSWATEVHFRNQWAHKLSRTTHHILLIIFSHLQPLLSFLISLWRTKQQDKYLPAWDTRSLVKDRKRAACPPSCPSSRLCCASSPCLSPSLAGQMHPSPRCLAVALSLPSPTLPLPPLLSLLSCGRLELTYPWC